MNKVALIILLILCAGNSFSQKRVAFGIKSSANLSLVKNEYINSSKINSSNRLGAGFGFFFNNYLGFENRYFWGLEFEYIFKSYSVNYNFSNNQVGKFISGASNPYLKFNFGRIYNIQNNTVSTIIGVSTDFYRLENMYISSDSIVIIKNYNFKNRSINLMLEIGYSKLNSRWNYSLGYNQGLIVVDKTYVSDFYNHNALLSTKFRGSCFMFILRYNLLKKHNS